MRVSVIIPAWNEAEHIGDCLRSVAAQTRPPDEVIVVDNNSTDNTATIAASFPFITLLHQTAEQGLIATRNMGFAHASGDILVRIDADIVLDSAWIERAVADFVRDPHLGGVTGLDAGHIIEHAPWQSTLWSRIYFAWTSATFRVPVLWGANMALRRSAWEQIKPFAVLKDTDAHEDLDLSVLLARCNWNVLQDAALRIHKDGREYHKWPKLKLYMSRRFRTLAHHKQIGSYQKAGSRVLPMWRTVLINTSLLLPGAIFFGTSLVAYYCKRALRMVGVRIAYD